MPSNDSVKIALALIERDKSKILGLKVGTHTNVQPGTFIPKADAQSPPALTFGPLSPEATYMVVALDIDAPFPSFGVLGPILHWIQPDLKATPVDGPPSSPQQYSLSSTTPFVANYIGPAPPPGSGPHRYVFFLYEQPPSFEGHRFAPPNGQKLSNGRRIRYSLDEWEEEARLERVLAVNYFKSN